MVAAVEANVSEIEAGSGAMGTTAAGSGGASGAPRSKRAARFTRRVGERMPVGGRQRLVEAGLGDDEEAHPTAEDEGQLIELGDIGHRRDSQVDPPGAGAEGDGEVASGLFGGE